MSNPRTPEQKAAHAAKERARRAAQRLADRGVAVQPDYRTDAHEANVCSAGIEAHEQHMALNGECPWSVKTAEPVTPDLSALDEMALYAGAKLEHRAKQIARKSGEQFATPYLDELNARKSAGRKVSVGPVRTPSGKVSTRHPLYAEAERIRKATNNHRGPGKKITPVELVDVARRLAGEGLIERQACEVAYWVEGWKVSRGPWAKAWAAATGPEAALG